jgi:hypothetical protein
LSVAAASAELLVFDGRVECRRLAGPIALQMSGRLQASAAVTELLFAGVTDTAALPAQLHEVCVRRTSATAMRIDAREGSFELQAHSMQQHRPIAGAFFQALPLASVPRATRLGWTVLLTALRLPGAARLLGRHRGAAP